MRLPFDPRLPQDDSLASLKRQLYSLFRDIAQQVNALSDGSIVAIDNSLTTAPTSGTWKQGDFVRNSAPVEAGAASSKYVITGWIRVTDGDTNVLNTDWLACRSLTGN